MIDRPTLAAVFGAAALRPGATEVDLAVADALLPITLPPTVAEFLRASNGLLIGDLEFFDTERMVDRTDDPALAHAFPNAIVIGCAGRDLTYLVHESGPSVLESWSEDRDPASMRTSADDLEQLLVRHRGRPVDRRAPDWALPGADEAVVRAVDAALQRIDAILAAGFGRRVGEPRGADERDVDVVVEPALAVAELEATEFASASHDGRPAPPSPGLTAGLAYSASCNRVAAELVPAVRARTLGLARPEYFSERVGDDATLVTLHSAAVRFAFEVLCEELTGTRLTERPGHALLTRFAAGRVPLGRQVDGASRIH